ncbi:hypothetical protein AOLI_G00296160 [Acnodon oligacanthus]
MHMHELNSHLKAGLESWGHFYHLSMVLYLYLHYWAASVRSQGESWCCVKKLSADREPGRRRPDPVLPAQAPGGTFWTGDWWEGAGEVTPHSTSSTPPQGGYSIEAAGWGV